MVTVYKTAYSPWLTIPLAIVITGMFALSLIDYAFVGSVVLAVCGIYFVYVYRNFRYVIDNNVLQVNCGALYSTKIDIGEIRKISETFSVLNQPAASFHRLEIIYRKFESIEISPKEQEKFIAQLKQLNPNIEFHFKK